MRPELVAIAVRNHGVFRRADAFACGYSSAELRGLTRTGGAWVIVRRGVYVERELWEAADDDGRYLMDVRAAMLNLEKNAYPSHGSAAVVLQLPLRPRWREVVHVTRPRAGGGRSEHGVRHHPAGVTDQDLVERDGLVVVAEARTALDIGREYGFEDGVCACDAVRRRGVSLDALRRVARGMRNWPGIVPARAAVEASDPGAENLFESLARVLVTELGLGRPRTQVRISDGYRTAYVDMMLGRHIFEFDGRVKYVGRERGGVLIGRAAEDALWDEKRREDWLRSQDHGVSRIVTADLFGEGRKRARERLRAECLATFRRYPSGLAS